LARTLYLHLGPAKTGTSAIQHTLSRHDGSVVLYPKAGLWGDGSHHNLVLNFFGDYERPEMVRQDADRLLEEIARQARESDRDLVISSEILAGRRNLGPLVDSLKHAIGSNIRVVLVVVLREHLERAASLYNQRVKDAVFAERRDPDAFLVEQPLRFCYASLLRRLAQTGFELVVLNYHPAQDCVARCLAVFGFAPERIPETAMRNVSLSRKALIATLAANRLSATRQDRVRFDAALHRISGRFVPSGVFFSGEAIARVRDVIAADRQFLRKAYAVKLPRRTRPKDANPLGIGEREFADIAAAVRELGTDGDRILEGARAYVRTAEPAAERIGAEKCEIS
jgi:hypothetical protein